MLIHTYLRNDHQTSQLKTTSMASINFNKINLHLCTVMPHIRQ